MDATIYEGSYVKETSESDFKSLVNGIAKANEPISFRLNVQDGKSVSISGMYSYAYQHLRFMDALDSEILEHGIAIVIATDYKNDVHTIFVVCE